MSNYEAVVILTAKISDEERNAVVEKYKTLLTENGELVNVDDWGRKTFAYEIKKEAEGYYLLFTFNAKPDFISEFERLLRLDSSVLKDMVIKK